MNNKPTGTVTFLFTDIEGSTRLSQEFPDALQTALEMHNSILTESVRSNNGFIFDTTGDAFCCAFESGYDAIKSAYDIQLKLANEKWQDTVIKVRIGIHSGKAEWDGSGYTGYITLARSARVMSAAYGEQVLISNDTFLLVKDKTYLKFSFRDFGERRLKDLIQPIRLYQLLAPQITQWTSKGNGGGGALFYPAAESLLLYRGTLTNFS